MFKTRTIVLLKSNIKFSLLFRRLSQIHALEIIHEGGFNDTNAHMHVPTAHYNIRQQYNWNAFFVIYEMKTTRPCLHLGTSFQANSATLGFSIAVYIP